MEYSIRPLSFAEILDRAFRVLADNAVLLIGIAAPLGIAEAALRGPGRWLPLVFLLVAMVGGPFVQAALTSAVAETYLNKPVNIASAYKSVWLIVLPFFGTCLLIYALFALGIGVIASIGFAFKSVHSKTLALIFIVMIIAAMPVTLYLMVRWSLLGPVMIVERRFGLAAIRRTSNLVLGVWWRTLGILLVAAIIVRLPLGVLGLLWSSIPVAGAVLTGLVTAIGYAYSAVVLIVYYFDRRCRLEDFDLRLLAEQIRSESVQGIPAMTGAPSLE
jgi:hypothetical protein